MEKITRIVYLIFLTLYSCTTLTSVTSAVGNATTSERGFTKTVEDTFIMTKIFTRLSALTLSNITNIKISVVYGNVLVSGYVVSQKKRLDIINSIWKVDGVKKIYNAKNTQRCYAHKPSKLDECNVRHRCCQKTGLSNR